MNFSLAIKRHEDSAAFYARIGKSKRARLEKLRAEQLRVSQQLKRETKADRRRA